MALIQHTLKDLFEAIKSESFRSINDSLVQLFICLDERDNEYLDFQDIATLTHQYLLLCRAVINDQQPGSAAHHLHIADMVFTSDPTEMINAYLKDDSTQTTYKVLTALDTAKNGHISQEEFVKNVPTVLFGPNNVLFFNGNIDSSSSSYKAGKSGQLLQTYVCC